MLRTNLLCAKNVHKDEDYYKFSEQCITANMLRETNDNKEGNRVRLITRSDFDGLACGALLLEAGIIDSWKFAHPKDLQDGLVEVNENDCLANVPFVEGCGLWFDHHSSEHERLALEGKYKGESRITPSCARIIYEYYGGRERFPQFDDMMEAVDKVCLLYTSPSPRDCS